jgi:hypothetical protein
MHNQELRFTSSVPIDELRLQLDARMNRLHMHNKSVLGKLLTIQMAEQISLWERKDEFAAQER